MARNDIFVNINAISPADAFVTGQQDMTAADAPELILGDTPTFNFYFTDNTNTWPSWAGNAAYTVTWALSDAVSGDFAPAATTGNATPITGGWSIDLPLNAYDLVGLLNSKRISQAYPVTYLWQQIRVTAPSGKEVTRAMVYTPIRYRAISDTQNTESATPTGGRFVTVNNTNDLTTPTLAQFYDANPVPASALPLGLGTDTAPANGELLIGNGTGYVTSTLTAGTGVTITNSAGSITIDATGAQEILTATVKNAESVPITKGQVVYLFSATGNLPSVKLASNSTDATSAKTFGVVSSTSIAANGTGTVTCVGVVDGLNLGAYNDGDTVYLGATAGTITATKPYAPNHLVYVGIIERANAGNGELYVKVQNGYELDEIHDVQITSAPAAGALLMRDATNSLWKANRLSAGTNIAVTNADTSVTIGLTGTVAVANGGTGVTTSTGSGSVVLSTSPSLTTPILGTPQSGTLTNCTGLPVSTGVSGLGSGVATFLATPTSANLRTVVTDETGTGALVFANTPSLVTPDIGAATGTSATLTGNANVSDVRLGGTSGPSAKSSIAARAARQGLVFDGTTAATASSSSLGTSFTIAFNTTLSSVSAQIPLLFFGGSGFVGTRASTGVLFFSSAASDFTSVIPAGKATQVVIVGNGSTATPYINGVAGTAIAYTASVSGLTALGYAGNPSLELDGVLLYNRALSAAEVVSLYEAGVPSGADYGAIGGNATNSSIVTGADSNFSSDTGNWAVALGSKTISGGTLQLTDGSSVYYAPATAVIPVGKKVRFTVTVSSITGGNARYYNGSSYVNFASSAGTYTVEFTALAATRFYLSVAGGNAVFDDYTAFWLGLLLAPDAAQAGGGLTWYDTSGNAANITLPASGVTWNVPTSGKMATSLSISSAVSATPGTNGVLTLNTTGTNPSTGSGGGLLLAQQASTGSLVNYGSIVGVRKNSAANDFVDLAIFTGGPTDAVALTERLRISAQNGNVLIGTTTDGGQKLQVAGTVYASSTIQSGGFKAGQNGGGYLEVSWASIWGTAGGHGLLIGGSGETYLNSATGQSLRLQTNGGTTALTLDSSQVAKFASNAVIGGGNAAGASTLTVNYTSVSKEPIGIANTASGGKTWYIGDGTGTSAGSFGFRNATDGVNAFVLSGTGNATFAGQIRTDTADASNAAILVSAATGATRKLMTLQVAGVSNGLQVTWNNSTSKLNVNLSDLPTSSSGLVAGTLYNDGGTLKIV